MNTHERVTLLVELAERRGVSSRELSRAAGRDETWLSTSLKRGSKFSNDELLGMARAARVSEWWLLTGKGHPDAEGEAAQSEPEGTEPFHGNRPGWVEAERLARLERPQYPEEVWRAAAAAAAYMVFHSPNVFEVVALADTVVKLNTSEVAEKIAAFRAGAEAEVAALQARQQRPKK